MSPDLNPDSSLTFENMNYLRREDIPILDAILSDLFVDAYSKSQIDVPVLIYPDSTRTYTKCKLNNIKNVYKFIDKMSKNFISESLAIWIDNWVLEYSDLSYLWQNKFWKLLILSKWTIENTTNKLKKRNLEQPLIFSDCEFKDVSLRKGVWDFILKTSANISDYESLSKHSYQEYEDGPEISIIDDIWLAGKTRSLNLIEILIKINNYFYFWIYLMK